MRRMFKIAGRIALLLGFGAGLAGLACAQEADLAARIAALEAAQTDSASTYVDNSYLFLIGGLIVMFMAAGFCLLEAGLVRAKNAAMQSMKNVLLYAVAGLMFWVIGYNLAYPATWIGDKYIAAITPGSFFWSPGDPALAGSAGYAPASDWFFQMVFVATAASIVSGTVAERVKLLPFLIFTAVLTGFIYPVVAAWEWGKGYLDTNWAFSDFAGSTLVHSVGGWAALMGALIIGPRKGRYFGKFVSAMPGSNIPLAALGTIILWFGWFGFNGASQLAAGSVANINAVATIMINTNMAAVGGTLMAAIVAALRYKGKVDATLVFNGAIGGLVSITAEPLAPSMGEALAIGAVGGVIVVLAVPLLDKLKIDDVVGAIPAHLLCGIFGTMVVPLTNSATSFAGQGVGVGLTAAFVIPVSFVTWSLLKYTIGVRVSEEAEMMGLDRAEVGLDAYPEFTSR